MKTTMLLLMAGAVALSPSVMLAKPGHGSGADQGAAMSQGHMSQPMSHTSQGHTSQGSTHGAGWDHLNGPSQTGQPGVECEDVRPGRSASAPGSAFNEEGKAGTRYAGEQPQNSRNTASVSQYDVACTHQPQH